MVLTYAIVLQAIMGENVKLKWMSAPPVLVSMVTVLILLLIIAVHVWRGSLDISVRQTFMSASQGLVTMEVCVWTTLTISNVYVIMDIRDCTVNMM
jgi:hypothetical protein